MCLSTGLLQSGTNMPKSPKMAPYSMLLCSLILLGALYPVLVLGGGGSVVWTVAFWVVLVASVHAIDAHPSVKLGARWLFGCALISGLAGVACYFLDIHGHGWIYITIRMLTVLYLLLVNAAIMWDVLRGGRVTAQTLIGAACAYLLVGLTFCYVFLLIHSIGGVNVIHADSGEAGPAALHPVGQEIDEYIYFSYVTLSTLGYGELIPSTPMVRVLAVAESMVGQLYLAMLVARLVGLHIVQSVQRSLTSTASR